jgi:uncharacterized circularly permuted ATP-grasp superfamily protein/uncharacterized alpha-E superfamily protein
LNREKALSETRLRLKFSFDRSLATDEWDYEPGHEFWDEAVGPDALPRAHWARFGEALREMGRPEFVRRWQLGQQIVRSNAITYNIYGDGRGAERLWSLDPIPLIIPEQEWEFLSSAIAQRAQLLNDLLEDVYGEQRLLKERRLPHELVFANPSFLRPCYGIPVPNGVRIHFYAVDLARARDGRWWVVSDRTQVPSGSGYALENRLVSTRTLANVFNQYSVRPLGNFFEARRHGMLSTAGGEKNMVLLTPGPYNETYFEHSFLAKSFAIPLVEGADLTVRDQKVYLKTLEGLSQVDLILRRQDDSFCDPLELRGESLLGVPGLLGAVRAGNVVISNSLGSGMIETPAHHAFLAGLSWALRGEPLHLPSVATWWCGQENEKRYVLERLESFIIKPTFPRFGQPPIFASQLDAQAQEELRRKIEARPAHYVAQELANISVSPVWNGERLEPRHVMLRAYAAWDGERYVVMPGGLTRVSDSLDSLVVAMQQGGGSKDTWVLGHSEDKHYEETVQPRYALSGVQATGDMPSRAADNLFWLGRYTERVEAMMRLLRAVVPALIAEEDSLRHVSLESVLELLVSYRYLPASVLHAPISEQLHKLGAMLKSMTQDPAAMTSLGWNLRQIRRTAAPVRERLSADTWRVLQALESESAKPANPYVTQRPAGMLLQLDQGIVSLAAFAGLLNESTTRGHGWRFLETGRRLERALAMTMLLRHGVAKKPSASLLELVLQISDSSITYRSKHLTQVEKQFVLELLLVDETNPRSVGFQLLELQDMARQFPRAEGDARAGVEERLAARALEAIRKADCRELSRRGALSVFLDDLDTALFDFSDAMTGHFLTHVMPSRLETY